MSEKWFGPKPVGYGVVPIHWKGWTVLIGFILTIVLFSLWASTAARPLLLVAGSLAMTAVFLWVCKIKGPKSWKASDYHDDT